MNWFKSMDNTYVTETSSMPAIHPCCPKCGQVVLPFHITNIDKDPSGEDTYGTHYQHPCGAELLIIND